MSTATTALAMSLKKTTQNVKQTEEKETLLSGDFEFIDLYDGIECEFEIISMDKFNTTKRVTANREQPYEARNSLHVCFNQGSERRLCEGDSVMEREKAFSKRE